jgi:hypothetical protein
MILAVLAWVVLTAGGCSNKSKNGRFTQEQMNNFPLAQTENLPQPSGGLVLNVGTETITAEEIVAPIVQAQPPATTVKDFESFKAEAWPTVADIVLERTTRILLYHEAKKLAPSDIDKRLERIVEQEVNRFVAQYEGNYAEAQKIIQDMGMDWDDFRDYIKRSILIESYTKKATKEKLITHKELLDYYNEVKEERFKIEGLIEFRLIDIDSGKVVAEENLSAKETSLALAKKLLGMINQGQDFGETAIVRLKVGCGHPRRSAPWLNRMILLNRSV